MAFARRQVEHRDIHFGIKGQEAIENSIGRLLKISREQKKEMEETLSLMQEGTKEYDMQLRKIAHLDKEMERLKNDASKLMQVLKDPGSASGREIKQVIKAERQAIERHRAELDENGLLTPESEKYLKDLVHDLQILEATQKATAEGFRDMTDELDKTAATYQDLATYVNRYEKSGLALARTYEDQAGAYAKMGANATAAKEELARLDGVIVAINEDSSKEELERMAAWFKQMQEYGGASAEQIKEFGEKYSQTMSVLAEKNMEIAASPQKHSINEVQEATKWLQEYKKDTILTEQEQERLNKAILQGSQHVEDALERSKTQVLAGAEAMKEFSNETERAAKLEQLGADGLARMRANLEAYKKTLKGTKAAEEMRKVEAMIADVDKAQRKLNADTIDWNNYKGDELKKRSLAELRNAYEILKKEVEQLSPAQEEYNKKAMMMRSLKKQTDELTKSTGEQTSAIGKMTDKIKGMVLAYVGFHALMSKTREIIRDASELSDLMTNVQKVAGLTADETGRMTDALQRLDTRSTTQQLLEIAEQGAKLGVATKGGVDAIVQFVKAGEQITNTLGSDVGAEAISDLLKVNDLLNKNSQGVEKDLLNVGSAILNVGNNSKASYANVLEFTRTMGAVGSVVDLTLPQVVALGGTLDSLGANMDSSATGIQRVLMGLNTNTAAVARAVHMGVKELEDLISEKGVLAALQEALLHIKNEGIVGINNFMKALGSGNSVQTRSAVALLIENLDVLNYQIRLAEQGYSDGTIVTHEFNKANENLAGTMKRVENEFYELFTNQQAANFFNPLAKGLLSFAKLLNSSATAAAAFGGTIAFVATQIVLAATKIDAIKAALTTLKVQLVTVGGGFKALGVWLVASAKSLFGVKGAADQATAAMNKLKAASMTNWITALITVLATLIVYFANLGKEISKATKATVDLRKAYDDQMATLNSLNDSLRKSINNEQERMKLIDEFNNKFGGYLTSLLDEKSTVEDIALAYLQAANAIREKNAAQMMNEAMPKALEAHSEELEDARTGIRGAVEGKVTTLAQKGGKTFTKEKQEEFINAIEYAVAEQVRKAGASGSTNDIYNAVRKQLEKEWSVTVREQTGYMGTTKAVKKNLVDEIKGVVGGSWVKDLIDAQKKVESTYSSTITSAKVMAADKTVLKQLLDDTQKEIDRQLKAYEDDKKDEFDLYGLIRLMEDYMSKANDSSPEMKKYREYAEKLAPKMREITLNKRIYGEPASKLEYMNTEELERVKQAVEGIIENYQAGEDITKSRVSVPGVELPKGISTWSKEDIFKWAKELYNKAKNLQDKNKLTGGGGSNKENKEEQQMKQEMEASLAKLEEYYERRQMMAEKALNNGRIGEDEYNRYLFANEQEHLIERQNLRKKWLKDDEQFMTKGVEELMSDVDFKKLSKFLADKGKAMTDGIKLNIAKDENAFEKNIRKNREKIEKILLDERPIAKIANAFVSDLADLRVLWNDGTEAVLQDSEAAQKEMIEKMSFLMNEAKKGYALTSKELIEDMVASGNPLLIEWSKQLTKEDNKAALNAIVLKTQGFFDEYEDAVRKMISKVSKRIEFEWKKIGPDGKSIEQSFADATKAIEKQQQSQAMADSWGLTGHNLAGVGDKDKLEIAMLEKKVELEKERYDLTVQRMREEHQAILDNAEASKRMAEDARKRAEELKKLGEGDPERQKELLDNQRIAAEKEKEAALLFQEAEAMKEASVRATTEAFENLKTAQEEATQGHLNLLSNAIEQARPYYDNLMTFAENFGENIFGSKKDRQQAAKELLASVIETTGKMLTQWLVYISTKRIFDQMEIAQEQAKQKMLLALQLEAKVAELKAQGQFEQAETTLGEATSMRDAALAQSKEAAKAGWAGWIIGAGLSLIMTTAFKSIAGKVRQTIQEETKVSSSGKLATGMLTYANGRYPTYSDGTMSVQGNDGNTYNATYKPNLSTGEYRTPHLGIVGEKGAELIVDSPTYKNLQRYRPDILDDIYRIHRYGTRRVDWGETARRGNEVLARRAGVRTFADGSIDEVLDGAAMADNTASQEALTTTLSSLATVLANIQRQGIAAHMSVYGSQGARSQLDKANKFMRKIGK